MFYFPRIAQPTTEISTVQEVLCQVKEKAESLKKKEAYIVLNHAVYCKALGVIMDPRNLELFNFVSLRAVIGKQFGAAGLKDVFIETSLIGIGFVGKVLKGKQYNKGVRALTIICEDLQRLKLLVFERWMHRENEDDILVDYLESTEPAQFINNTKKQNNTKRASFIAVVFHSCERIFEFFYILTKVSVLNLAQWLSFVTASLK